MRKTLVTIIDGEDHKRFAELTMPTFERYADRYGYEIVVAEKAAEVPTAQWSKPIALREALEDYDLAVWVDIDAAISDAAPDIAGYLIDSLAFQALSWLNYEPQGMKEDHAAVSGKKPNIIDTGVWAVQRHPTAARFLDEMLKQRDLYGLVNGGLDTAAVWRLLGAMDVSRMDAARRGWWPFATGTLLLRECWNARLDWFARHLGAEPYIFHAASMEAPGNPEDIETRVDLLCAFVQQSCTSASRAPNMPASTRL